MERELKIWGERWIIRKDSVHSINYLSIRKGYRCSWHVHQTKHNLFVVLEGQLILVIEELNERRLIPLFAGDTFTIKPGQWHEFRATTDCKVLEEMYVEYNEDDITREKVGSVTFIK